MRIWRTAERVLELVAMLALFSLVLLPATQVFMRDMFNSPIIGLEEATRWGLIILVFFQRAAADLYKRADRFAETCRPAPATVPAGARALHLSLLRAGCRMHRLCRGPR